VSFYFNSLAFILLLYPEIINIIPIIIGITNQKQATDAGIMILLIIIGLGFYFGFKKKINYFLKSLTCLKAAIAPLNKYLGFQRFFNVVLITYLGVKNNL